jgi:excisionase family DNA binding protein
MDNTDYFTPAEVAQRLRVDRTTVMRWIRIGVLEAETTQQGRRKRHRIKKSVIEAIERRDPERHTRLV